MSAGVSWIEARKLAPALNTATCTGPCSDSSASNRALTPCSSRTSVGAAKALPPAFWISPARRARRSALLAASATLKPACAKRRARAKPRPSPTPAITATGGLSMAAILERRGELRAFEHGALGVELGGEVRGADHVPRGERPQRLLAGADHDRVGGDHA